MWLVANSLPEHLANPCLMASLVNTMRGSMVPLSPVATMTQVGSLYRRLVGEVRMLVGEVKYASYLEDSELLAAKLAPTDKNVVLNVNHKNESKDELN